MEEVDTTVEETATESTEEKEVVTGEEPASEEGTEQSASGEGEGNATEEKEATQTEEGKEHSRKKDYQGRIDELTWKFRDKEREAEYWKNLASQGQAKPPASETKPPAEEAVFTKPRPKVDDFKSVEEYEDAVYGWRKEKEDTEKKVSEIKTEAEKKVNEFKSKTAKLKEKHPEFDEIVNSAKVFTKAMADAILHSDNSAEISLHLALPENKELADKIARMPAERQYVEIGRLDAKFSSGIETKAITKAPTPFKPIDNTVGGEGDVDWEKMSSEKMEAEMRKRGLL